MPTKGTSVKGIRLPDAVWKELDAEAAAVGMSRNEFITRRILHRPEVCKVAENVDDGDGPELVRLSDD